MRSKSLLTGMLALCLTSTAFAQSFTYQGSLNDAGVPANGPFNMTFALFDALSGGSQVGSAIAQNNVDITNGLFSTELDFGASAFTGANRWLEISVSGTPLTPRQKVTAAPMATFATKPWVTSGTALSYTNGFVGIGTATPSARLDVNGRVGIENQNVLELGLGVVGKEPSAGRIGYQTFSANALDIVGAGTTATNRRINLWAEGGVTSMGPISAPAATIPTLNGNVGVGTSTPTSRLDVAGTFESDGFKLNGNGAAAGKVLICDGNGVGTWQAAPNGSQWTTSGNDISYDTGNVGIGTSAPMAALDVDGNFALRGTNTLEFGAGIAGKEVNAGKIGYQVFSANKLDIVGAGTSSTNRKINLIAEGGIHFTGPLLPAGAVLNVSGNLQTSGALIADVAVRAPRITGLPQNEVDDGGFLELRGAGSNTDWLVESHADRLRFVTNVGEVASIKPNGELTANVVTILGGSDVAEPYEVAAAGEVQPAPGMVVAIDPAHVGQMRVASSAYDRTVAGILSGANGIAPGITLRQKGSVADGTHPVASIGRVWCWCTAEQSGPINAGDMLTTSDTAGHAMPAADSTRANGAIIGKAMSSLKSGRGLVLVLVSLK